MLAVLALGATKGTAVTLEADDDAEGHGRDAVDAPRRPARAGPRRRARRWLIGCHGVGVGVGAVARGPLVTDGAAAGASARAAVERRQRRGRAGRSPRSRPSAPTWPRRSPTASDTTATAVLDALSMIAADPTLVEQVDELIAAGARRAPRRARRPSTATARSLADAGGYLAERAADLADIRDRVDRRAPRAADARGPRPRAPVRPGGRRPLPRRHRRLDPASVLALVTDAGGPPATRRSWPGRSASRAWWRCDGIMDDRRRHPGRRRRRGRRGRDRRRRVCADAALDERAAGPGARAERLRRTGRDRRRPSGRAAPQHRLGGRPPRRRRRRLRGRRAVPHRVPLPRPRRSPERSTSSEHAYAAVLRAADGRKVVVRTLDAGADKPLPFLASRPEPNPALGVRGLRVARAVPRRAGRPAARRWPRPPPSVPDCRRLGDGADGGDRRTRPPSSSRRARQAGLRPRE